MQKVKITKQLYLNCEHAAALASDTVSVSSSTTNDNVKFLDYFQIITVASLIFICIKVLETETHWQIAKDHSNSLGNKKTDSHFSGTPSNPL